MGYWGCEQYWFHFLDFQVPNDSKDSYSEWILCLTVDCVLVGSYVNHIWITSRIWAKISLRCSCYITRKGQFKWPESRHQWWVMHTTIVPIFSQVVCLFNIVMSHCTITKKWASKHCFSHTHIEAMTTYFMLFW